MMNEEHQMKNDVEVNYGRNSMAPQPHFLFFLLLTYISQNLSMLNVATYPSAGRRRVTRGMRLPRKEYARSRHQRLFEENVGKTGKDKVYKL